MRNTPMPLSIAYVDAGGRLVSTADMDAVPTTRPTARATRPPGPTATPSRCPRAGLDDLGIDLGGPARGSGGELPAERRPCFVSHAGAHDGGDEGPTAAGRYHVRAAIEPCSAPCGAPADAGSRGR